MTQKEIARLAQHNKGHIALCIALVELCYKDIAKFARLHKRYSELQEMNDYQRGALQLAAMNSTSAKGFLQESFIMQWGIDAANSPRRVTHGGLQGRVM